MSFIQTIRTTGFVAQSSSAGTMYHKIQVKIYCIFSFFNFLLYFSLIASPLVSPFCDWAERHAKLTVLSCAIISHDSSLKQLFHFSYWPRVLNTLPFSVRTIIYARADLQIFLRLTFYFCTSSTEFSHYWPSRNVNSDLITKKRWKIIYLQLRPHLTNIRKMRQKKEYQIPRWETVVDDY